MCAVSALMTLLTLADMLKGLWTRNMPLAWLLMGTTPGMPHPSAGLMATLRTLGALTQPTCHLSMYSQYHHATTAQRGATPPLWLKTPISQCTAQAQLHLRATPLLLQHQLKGSPITLSSNSLQGKL